MSSKPAIKTYKKKPAVKHTVKISKRSNMLFQPTIQRAELKNHDRQFNSVTLAGSWSALENINLIGLGTSPTERVGRKVCMKSLLCRFTQTGPVIAPTRLLIIYDKSGQNNSGTQPLITDILSTNTMESPLNLANAERFVVLSDHMIQPNGTLVGGAVYKKMALDFVAKNVIPGVTPLADVTTGTMFLTSCALVAVTTSMYTRVRFEDQ